MRATTLLIALLMLAVAGLSGLVLFGASDSVVDLDQRIYDRATGGVHWKSGSAVCPGPYRVPIELFICIRDQHRRELGKCPRLERVAFGTDRLQRPTVSMEGSTPYCEGEPAGQFSAGMNLVHDR
jgi:hypothetical protein